MPAPSPVREPRPQLWTIDDAAEHLKCNRETVRRLISDGNLRAYRYGPRMVRIDPRDIDRMRRPIGARPAALD